MKRSAAVTIAGSSSFFSLASEPIAVMWRPGCNQLASMRGMRAGVVVTTTWLSRTTASGVLATTTGRARRCVMRVA